MKLDHIEIFVPKRWEAAQWYSKVLGFTVLEEHIHWADEGGPLMISNDQGQTMLALFKGSGQGDAKVRGFRRLAFRVSATEFVSFVRSSGSWRSPALDESNIQDHDKALSVYFSDPHGNLLEVTTYDYQEAKALGVLGSRST